MSWQAEHGGPDGRPARESSPDPRGEARFDAAGETWIARVAGKGAIGTGATGLGLTDAVHFYRATAPDEPVSEAVLARGRFALLFEEELRTLLARARPIVIPEPGAPAAQPSPRRRR